MVKIEILLKYWTTLFGIYCLIIKIGFWDFLFCFNYYIFIKRYIYKKFIHYSILFKGKKNILHKKMTSIKKFAFLLLISLLMTIISAKNCKTFSVNRQACTAKGGVIKSITLMGCPFPTCVTKPCPTVTIDRSGCSKIGGRISTTTKNNCPTPTCICPTFTVNSKGCSSKGGKITYITKYSCPTPVCAKKWKLIIHWEYIILDYKKNKKN